MKDFSEKAPLLDQLKSLSIERDVDFERPRDPRQKETTGAKGRLIWLSLALGLTGGGVWYFDQAGYLDVQDLYQNAQGLFARSVSGAPVEPATSVETNIATETVMTQPTATPPPVPARVAPPVIGSGYVVSERQIALQAEVAGRISEINVDVGDRFSRGDVLVRIDDRAFLADLAIARKKVDRAASVLARRKAEQAEAHRQAELMGKQVARELKPRSMLADMQQAVILAQSEVAIAESDRELANLNYLRLRGQADDYSIRAPFDGVVVNRGLTQGALVSSGLRSGIAVPVLTLVDPQALIIEADVSERNLGQIFVGQKAEVTLDAYPNRRFIATVVSVVQQVSVQKGTVTVRLGFDTPPMGVLANMSARLEFTPENAKN